MAATGRQLKQSVNVFHNLMLYRRLPEKVEQLLKQNTIVIYLTKEDIF